MENQFLYLQDFFTNLPHNESANINEAVIQKFRKSSRVLDGGASFLWLVNYFKREPEYVSDSVKQVLGYPTAHLLNAPLAAYMKLIHEEDRMFLKKVFSNIRAYYLQIPPEEKHLYRFDFNYRVQRADQRFISVVQQTMFLQNSLAGLPMLEMSVVTDFSTYSTHAQIGLQVFKMENGAFKQIHSFEYEQYPAKLTEREKEVIDLIAVGLTDKEIAEKFQVSLHTVKTHRKHIVHKTKSRNTAEAINKYLSSASVKV